MFFTCLNNDLKSDIESVSPDNIKSLRKWTRKSKCIIAFLFRKLFSLFHELCLLFKPVSYLYNIFFSIKIGNNNQNYLQLTVNHNCTSLCWIKDTHSYGIKSIVENPPKQVYENFFIFSQFGLFASENSQLLEWGTQLKKIKIIPETSRDRKVKKSADNYL